MIKFFPFCFCLFFSSLLAQKNSFEGQLLLKNNSIVPYSLDISIDSSYGVSGYSYFGHKNNMTRSYVEGLFNPDDNSLFLQEIEATPNLPSWCPIFIQGRVSHLINDIFVIAGLFVSKDRARCGTGHINVVNRNFKFNLYQRLSSNIAIQNDSLNTLALKNLLEKNLTEEIKFQSVSAGDLNEISTSKKSIILRVYDQMKIDKDKVKITFNSQVIDNLELTGEKQEYRLTAKNGQNTLSIEAINEGTIPMNTSKMEVVCEEKTYFFINKIYKNQKTSYVITLK